MSNSSHPQQEKTLVPPDLYSREYYLTDCDGCHEYTKGLDNNVHPKFKRALELADIKPGERALDIGCGRGELIYYCVKQGATALGLDYSRSAIDIARETAKHLPSELQTKMEAHVGNAESFPFHGKFDVIFMIEVAEHMYDWQLQKTFTVFEKLLSEQGRIIIMTPNYYYEKYLQPLKRFLDIPFRLFKWPIRILRKKYKPKSFRELLEKIFKVRVYRNDLCYKMHVNITTPRTMKELLRNFEIDVHCEDPSINPISLLLQKWWGREIVVVAKKR